jgi:hypothetical protein
VGWLDLRDPSLKKRRDLISFRWTFPSIVDSFTLVRYCCLFHERREERWRGIWHHDNLCCSCKMTLSLLPLLFSVVVTAIKSRLLLLMLLYCSKSLLTRASFPDLVSQMFLPFILWLLLLCHHCFLSLLPFGFFCLRSSGFLRLLLKETRLFILVFVHCFLLIPIFVLHQQQQRILLFWYKDFLIVFHRSESLSDTVSLEIQFHFEFWLELWV